MQAAANSSPRSSTALRPPTPAVRRRASPLAPTAITEIDDPRMAWFSFQGLSDAIDAVLADRLEIVPEREHLLLRELQALFESDGLLASPLDVVVVAAGKAFDQYIATNAYVCQPGRTFKRTTYIGFYRQKRIERPLARILHVQDDVKFSKENAAKLRAESDEYSGRIADVIDVLLHDASRVSGEKHKVFVLSGPEDPATSELETPLIHDGSGAWVQGQRYASSESLREARATSDLIQ